ncbi:hypothetical protein COTS27_00180 [Spirochaetota bacterium]|nr:hypothetical protein COTS27_00180 [Spirochaetota bacterium]
MRLLTLSATFTLCSIALSLLLTGCQRNPNISFDPYLDVLPEKETINASLYHYELLTEMAEEKFKAGAYLEVLQIYKNYLTIFYESEVSNKNRLLYYVGLSLKKLCENGRTPYAFKKFLATDAELLSLFGLIETSEQSLQYNHIHFREILENRIDYTLEWNVLREYYLEDFNFAPATAADHDANFAHLYYLVTRFPNMVDYNDLAKNPTLINPEFFSTAERKKFAYIEELITQYEDFFEPQLPPLNIHVFSKTGGLVIRNRSNLISSRNFARIAAWEPLLLLGKVQGEDNRMWWEVSYLKEHINTDIDIPRGYIPAENGFLTDLETLDGTPLPLDLTEQAIKLRFESYLATKTAKSHSMRYLAASTAFYNKNYLTTIEILSGLIPESTGLTQERSLTLFHKTLNEIARRSTSLDSAYTRFVIQYPHYFTIHHTPPQPPELKVTEDILNMLIKANHNSIMLQYYNDS